MAIKDIIRSNKAVIKFLIVFFGSYTILALLYQGFLTYVTFDGYYPDIITHQVAMQSYHLIDVLGFDVQIFKDSESPSMMIAINGENVVRVIEGCNSISVIILFLSFVLAFFRGFKSTLIFILTGSVIIYILNVTRVALLVLGLYFYKDYGDLLHDIVFPLFIYGVVLVLWLIWIKKYKNEST
jgi:exosortase family protein XrtF